MIPAQNNRSNAHPLSTSWYCATRMQQLATITGVRWILPYSLPRFYCRRLEFCVKIMLCASKAIFSDVESSFVLVIFLHYIGVVFKEKLRHFCMSAFRREHEHARLGLRLRSGRLALFRYTLSVQSK